MCFFGIYRIVILHAVVNQNVLSLLQSSFPHVLGHFLCKILLLYMFICYVVFAKKSVPVRIKCLPFTYDEMNL